MKKNAHFYIKYNKITRITMDELLDVLIALDQGHSKEPVVLHL